MSPAMAPPPDGDMVSIKQRAAIAARLRSTIEQSFAHWDAVPDLDFDAAFDAYLNAALAAGTRLDFVLACQRLMAQLRNGHSGFHDDWVMRRHGQSFGLMLRPLAGRSARRSRMVRRSRASGYLQTWRLSCRRRICARDVTAL